MKEYYKQPIVVFGIVLPILVMGVFGGVAYHMSSSVTDDYKKKKIIYDKAQQEMSQMMAMQGKIQKTSVQLKRWDKLLARESRGTFLEHWKEAEKKFSGRELTKTSHNWVNYSEGIGKGTSQPSSQVNMSFSATFRAMQLAMLEMETNLPQMQLDSLIMTPAANGQKMNFETQFTVWTLK